jgi:hypothetical protein
MIDRNHALPIKHQSELLSIGRSTMYYRPRPCRGDMWTLCVSASELHELHPKEPFVPAAVFNTLRAAIYGTAFARMASADPIGQHELSVADVREALERLLDQASDCLPEIRRLNRG